MPVYPSLRTLLEPLDSPAQARERVLSELLRPLPEGSQAFWWVEDGGRFSLQTALGLAGMPLGEVGVVEEAAFQKGYPGPVEGWSQGLPAAEVGPHLLQHLSVQLPASPEPPVGQNLLLPLVLERRVWAVLHLYAPSPLDEPRLKRAIQSAQAVVPLLQQIHRWEAAERKALWLSAINTLLSHPEPESPPPLEASAATWLKSRLQDALEEATRLARAEGARLVAFKEGQVHTLAQAGWDAGLPVETALRAALTEQLGEGRRIALPRYDLYPARHPELVEAGLHSLFILSVPYQSQALLLFSSQAGWFPDAETQEFLGEMATALGVVQREWALRQELAWAAFTDPLTSLGNRRAFERDLEKLPHRARGRLAMLVVLDLDRFKSINDSFGHIHADHVLVRLAGVLRSRARAGDRAYRLGGDEFALIIEGPPSLNPSRIAERYRALVEEVRVSESVHLQVSLGYAVYPSDAPDTEALWRLADRRMYQDKASRRNRASQTPPPLIPHETLLVRLARRMGQALGFSPAEMQGLEAGCYLLQLALGELSLGPVTLSDSLLREGARILVFLHQHREGGRPSSWTGEAIPRAARVLQVAHWFTQALKEVEGRSARSVEEALAALQQEASPYFDPDAVSALLSLREWLEELVT
ncbi:MAG: diguanylate cyclase [Meiothermus sp.]|nr:diguanylate cyclase [Meiothermus sp.]